MSCIAFSVPKMLSEDTPPTASTHLLSKTPSKDVTVIADEDAVDEWPAGWS